MATPIRTPEDARRAVYSLERAYLTAEKRQDREAMKLFSRQITTLCATYRLDISHPAHRAR